MAEPRKSKPRLTLRDLATVEVPNASVNDVLGADSLPSPESAGANSDSAGTDNEGEVDLLPDDGAPSARPRMATSGPVSTRQLQALPEGVSPEVVAMLGLPEASSLVEPEAETEVQSESTPEPTESTKSGGTLVAMAILLTLGGSLVTWYATRPPALDVSLYELRVLAEPAPETAPTVEIAFLPVPEPVVPIQLTAPEGGEAGNGRIRRSVRTEVREEDLF